MASNDITLIVCVFVLCVIVVPAISCECHLRTQPLLALGDGLRLQIRLMANKHKEFKVLPKQLILKENNSNKNETELISNLLNLIIQYHNTTDRRESATARTATVLRRLQEVVISDSCAYVSLVLNQSIDCYNISSIESLAVKLKLQETTNSLFSGLLNSDDEVVGSDREIYAYWREHVAKACTPDQVCPRLNEIENAIRFRTRAKTCTCS